MVFPATWLVWTTVAIVLVLFALGYYWARTHGQLEDVEEAKYAMLRNECKDIKDEEEGQ